MNPLLPKTSYLQQKQQVQNSTERCANANFYCFSFLLETTPMMSDLKAMHILTKPEKVADAYKKKCLVESKTYKTH